MLSKKVIYNSKKPLEDNDPPREGTNATYANLLTRYPMIPLFCYNGKMLLESQNRRVRDSQAE